MEGIRESSTSERLEQRNSLVLHDGFRQTSALQSHELACLCVTSKFIPSFFAVLAPLLNSANNNNGYDLYYNHRRKRLLMRNGKESDCPPKPNSFVLPMERKRQWITNSIDNRIRTSFHGDLMNPFPVFMEISTSFRGHRRPWMLSRRVNQNSAYSTWYYLFVFLLSDRTLNY